MGVPAHEATTRHLGAAYPFASEAGLGGRGVLIGRDLLGGAFAYDPFELYRSGHLTNPNMVVIGQIGRGKSAFVKTYLWRLAVWGRRAWVVDPKGEYGALARTLGVEPVALRPGGSIRLNPLDAVPSASAVGTDDEDVARQRCELLASLATASLGRTLLPTERSALDVAVADASSLAPASTRSDGGSPTGPTLPTIVDALLYPEEHSARALGTDVAGLAADGRNVALELRRLVAGDLRRHVRRAQYLRGDNRNHPSSPDSARVADGSDIAKPLVGAYKARLQPFERTACDRPDEFLVPRRRVIRPAARDPASLWTPGEANHLH